MNSGDTRRLFDLTGKVAVVTGGVGLLGRFFCAALADHGAAVAVVDLDAEATSSFAKELAKTFDVATLGVGCDVSDDAGVRRMADTVEARLGPVSILHNNAASKGRSLDAFFEPPEKFDISVWREIMATNLDGSFLVAREIGARMAQRGFGSIIQTASIYGALGPDQRIYAGSEYLGRPINTPAVYSASKSGVIGLSRYFATYWGHRGVRVNTLTPGGVASGQNAVFEHNYSQRIPLGRMGSAGDMVGALVFLASDASSYVTGQNIMVDGGLSAW
jgi:NAD(P)-dependent dehydrogenase (short-subunit alcohol dehydrogenase family)